MALHPCIELADDPDGGHDARTCRFGRPDAGLEIDVTDTHRDDFVCALQQGRIGRSNAGRRRTATCRPLTCGDERMDVSTVLGTQLEVPMSHAAERPVADDASPDPHPGPESARRIASG
ncbi:hypothetical protein [Cellulomonas sp. WB94]|uniref:hypothetical protein n=1 Tax=Cellulomonas sp. WB94 TaxID=2173174 RepID=UPI0011B2262A|nr:hypothetical protein [Cellulomonas sp. WB94]